jgi:hypothetical protein
MKLPKSFLGPLTISVTLLTASIVAAQTAPEGSCLLPDDEGWCWPLTPGTYGEPCDCQTSDGVLSGTTQ